ncbi:ribosomal protein S5 domain 2-like protein [Ramaria rubella]|nr:ribosomal protein S5 domain 2-like protein [Ramaria rubella]
MDPNPAPPTPSLPKPPSSTFYTARPDFYDGLRTLEDALQLAQHTLRKAHLFPFPDTARTHLPPPRVAWKTGDALAHEVGAGLTTARERRVQGLLNQLNDMRRIAVAGAEDELAAELQRLLGPFERADKDQLLARGRRKPVLFDEHGRTYALGKRKESAARVWMIPVRTPESESAAEQTDGKPTPATTTTYQSAVIQPQHIPPVQPTTVLVNNLPLATYFVNTADREHVVRPFKLAGLLGAFNVFALVRGGGTTGQAEAVAHGIAQNLVAHVPDVELILRRGESCLLKRDPRMVERKKTGLAKARKRYAWVKR